MSNPQLPASLDAIKQALDRVLVDDEAAEFLQPWYSFYTYGVGRAYRVQIVKYDGDDWQTATRDDFDAVVASHPGQRPGGQR